MVATFDFAKVDYLAVLWVVWMDEKMGFVLVA
jgi:hypothetical protein